MDTKILSGEINIWTEAMFSPDGTKVALMSGTLTWASYGVPATINRNLAVMNVSGTEKQALLTDSFDDSFANSYVNGEGSGKSPLRGVWSQDGSKLVFFSNRTRTTTSIPSSRRHRFNEDLIKRLSGDNALFFRHRQNRVFAR